MMEWNYTMTGADVRRFVCALSRTKGTGAWRQQLMLRAVGLVAGAAAFVPALLRQPGALPMGAAGLVVVTVEALAWGFAGLVHLAEQLLLFRLSGQWEKLVGPCTVQAGNGWYCHTQGGNTQFTKKLREIEEVWVKCGGVLVVFDDRTADFLPGAAVVQTGGAAAVCEMLMKAAAEAVMRPDPEPLRPAKTDDASESAEPSNGPAQNDFSFEGAWDGELKFDIRPEEAGPLMAACTRAVYHSAAYWRGQWVTLAFLVLCLILGLVERNALLLGIPALTAALMAWQVFHGPRKMMQMGRDARLSAITGPQSLFLEKKGIRIVRVQNGTLLPWTTIRAVGETPAGCYLLQQKPLSILPIPHSAFDTDAQKEAFFACVKAHYKNG